MAIVVKVDCSLISDWDSFHDAFSEAFGFPPFYGRNMDAWIDCMTDLDQPEAGMTTVHARPGSVLVLELLCVDAFVERCPEQYAALIDAAAFVNWRRIEQHDEPVLALSFCR